LSIIEDAAHAFGSTRFLKPPGHHADLTVLSFHETKNIISGEGGALLINNDALRDRALILWEKGTNRRQFFDGLVDKYTWVDQGSSFLPSEIVAAFLLAQIEQAEKINTERMKLWMRYQELFAPLEKRGKIRRPIISQNCAHNAHMFYLILNTYEERQGLLAYLSEKSINAVFHYVPLHSSPGGTRFGRTHGDMKNTDNLSRRLLRLPLWNGLSNAQLERVVSEVENYFQ
jgi:dTDP-4-amino-4,6-dideoxygalactose transaminase